MVARIVVEMLGVRLAVESDYADLVEYVRLHLPDHVAPPGPAAIEVRVDWLEGRPDDGIELGFPDQAGLDRVGKRLLAGPDTLVWTDTLRIKNLVLRFRKHGGHLAMEARYAYAPRAAKLEEQPNYRYKKFFGLMSWFVFFPLAWYLEHERGIYLMHAAGIEVDGRGIVIGGVGGVGKTTTAVSLLARPGSRLVSENLVFYDAERIYSCYEPIRLDDASVDLLGERRRILERAEIPDGANHKNLYHVRRQAVTDGVPAAAVFVPRFTPEPFVRLLAVDRCLELLLAFNTLTREINDYQWFAATLDVAWPTERSLERRAATLRALLERAHCYELGIDRRRGVEPVVQAVLERTRNGARS